jgi:hypothetical protein
MVLSALTVLVLGITGCGDGGTDSALKDRIKAMNDLVDGVKAKDADKIKDAEKRISDADAILDKASTSNLQYAYLNNKDEFGRAVVKISMCGDNSKFSLGHPKWEERAKPAQATP